MSVLKDLLIFFLCLLLDRAHDGSTKWELPPTFVVLSNFKTTMNIYKNSNRR
jgi:hypothetical protein